MWWSVSEGKSVSPEPPASAMVAGCAWCAAWNGEQGRLRSPLPHARPWARTGQFARTRGDVSPKKKEAGTKTDLHAWPCTHHLTMLDTFQARFEHLFYGKQNAHQQLHIPTLLLSGVGALYLLSFAYKLVHVLIDLHVLPAPPSPSTAAGGPHRRHDPSMGRGDRSDRWDWARVCPPARPCRLFHRAGQSKCRQAVVCSGRDQGSQCSAETRTAVIDFSKADAAQYAALEATLASLNIGVLVNNVGKSHDMPVPFAETTLEEMMSISEININSTLRVTRMVVPGMVQQ
ncbi:hypothetical protein L7F22_043107 [Adiantum nelumboides]|nr:hypothetical protein [Adiantum nelumboides]